MGAVCQFCGHILTLEVEPYNEDYERAKELLKRLDPRFKGERYRYICKSCGRQGPPYTRTNYPDMSGQVTTPDTAKTFPLWL